MSGPIETRHVAWNVAVPAGTTAASPVTSSAPFANVVLESIHLRIPSGHVGLTGLRLDDSSSTVLPFSNPPAYIIGDDDRLDFAIDQQVGTKLVAVAYNLDVFDHTFYMLARVTDFPLRNAGATFAPVRLLDIQAN